MRSFQDFCVGLATSTPIVEGPDKTVDDKYKDILKVIIKDLRNKRNVFNNINVVYIENMLNTSEALDKLVNNTNGDEIPYGIIYELSKGIFDKEPTDLNVTEQSIIKVVSVYIWISK